MCCNQGYYYLLGFDCFLPSYYVINESNHALDRTLFFLNKRSYNTVIGIITSTDFVCIYLLQQ